MGCITNYLPDWLVLGGGVQNGRNEMSSALVIQVEFKWHRPFLSWNLVRPWVKSPGVEEIGGAALVGGDECVMFDFLKYLRARAFLSYFQC